MPSKAATPEQKAYMKAYNHAQRMLIRARRNAKYNGGSYATVAKWLKALEALDAKTK